MHKWLSAVLVLALSLPVIAQGGRGAPPPRPAAGQGIDVGGWFARLDDPKEPRTGLKFVTMGTGLHATTGPTVILFDPMEDWEGPYTTKATLTMTQPASHQVAYGLFVGGQDLDTDKQRYTYFVIRQDGKYLIVKRTGSTTTNVAGDWADHAAIRKPDAKGSQTNELAIQVGSDTVVFRANGQTVATHPRRRSTSSACPDYASATASTCRSKGSLSRRISRRPMTIADDGPRRHGTIVVLRSTDVLVPTINESA